MKYLIYYKDHNGDEKNCIVNNVEELKDFVEQTILKRQLRAIEEKRLGGYGFSTGEESRSDIQRKINSRIIYNIMPLPYGA